MTKALLILAIFGGLVGCTGAPADPPLRRSPPGGSGTAAIEGVVLPEAWCSPGAGIPSHELVLEITLPDGRGPITIAVPVVRCFEASRSFPDGPSACLSADSIEPREWFNGCVNLRATTLNSVVADLDLSWRSEKAAKHECTESITISFSGPIQASTKCGVSVAGHFQRASGRSNNRLNPPVGPVTTLAESARIAPVPPTG